MKTKHTPSQKLIFPLKKFLTALLLTFLFHTIPARSQSYCTVDLAYYGCDYYSAIDNFSLSNISQSGTGCTGGTGVVDYTALSCNLAQGESYTFSFSTNSGYYVFYDQLAIWVDLNDDFDFDDADELFYTSITGGTLSAPFPIPSTAPIGSHRMRVRCVNNYQPLLASDACTPFYYGETHDYTANITAPPPCPGFSSATISNVGLNSADLSWTCNGCSGPFVVEYGSPGFTPGTGATAGVGGQVMNPASSPATLSSLNASSNYQVYVRRNCGIDGFSSNYGPLNFTTLWDACGTLSTIVCDIEVTAQVPGGEGAFNFNPNFTDGKEILYSFTPAVSGIYTLTILSTNSRPANYLVKDATTGCNSIGWSFAQTLPWETLFFNPITIILDTLQSGHTYYVCVNSPYTEGTTHSFKINCYAPYDPCPPSGTITCGVSQQTAIPIGLGAYTYYDGQEFNFGQEKIYSFTPGTTGIYTLTVNSMNGYSGASYYYKKASDGGGCSINNWHHISLIGIAPVTILLGTLTAGTEYYVMVDARFMDGADHNFLIDCVSPSSPCLSVQSISCATTVNVEIPPGAGAFGMAQCFYPGVVPVLAGKEQIFQFTPATSGRSLLHILSNAGPNWNTSFHYFIKPVTGGCNSSGWTCLGQGYPYPGWYDIPFALIAGNSYYILVDALGFEGNTQTFEITCPEAVDPCAVITAISCSTEVQVSIPAGHGIYNINQACLGNDVNCMGKELIYSFSPVVSGTYALQILSSNYQSIKYQFKDAASGCNDAGWKCWVLASYPYGTDYSFYSPEILLAGHTYYILLDAADPVLTEQTFVINCPLPTNPCSAITSITCGSLTSFDNPHGLGELDPPLNSNAYSNISGNFPGRESIFEFTATVTGNHLLSVESALGYTSVGYFIKAASGGCNNNNWELIGGIYYPTTATIPIALQAGVSYYILADSYTEGQSFSIICPETEYDPCSDIPLIAGCGISVTTEHDPGLGGLAVLSSCSPGNPGKENVFRFTPSSSGYHGIEVTGGTGNTIVYYIKTAATGCATGGWQCISPLGSYGGVAKIPLYLNAGTEYYILADASDTLGASLDFQLICPAPSICSDISVFSGCGFENYITDSIGNGINNYTFPACYYSIYVDRPPQGMAKVYSYTPDLPGISKLETYNLWSGGAYLRFYIKPALLGCDENNWTCIPLSYDNSYGDLPFVLTPGTAYYILVVAEGYYGTSSNFRFGFECPSSCVQYADNDIDGYGGNQVTYNCFPTYGYVYESGDCNDNASVINPAATEICSNSIDDNCDGNVDEGCSTEGGNTYASNTTNCTNFSDGTAPPVTGFCYLVKKGKVSTSTPGVLSYFVKVKAPVNGTFKVEVRQTNNGSLPLLHVSALNQMKAFNSSCLQLTASGIETYSSSLQKATVTITGATFGQIYIVSVKYDIHTIVGASSPPASCPYSFTAYTVVGVVSTPVANSTTILTGQSGCTIARESVMDEITETELHAFPNPMTHASTIGFVLPENDVVTLRVIDITGREVQNLYSGMVEADMRYEASLDGSRYENGIYFLVLTSQSGIRKSLKLILSR